MRRRDVRHWTRPLPAAHHSNPEQSLASREVKQLPNGYLGVYQPVENWEISQLEYSGSPVVCISFSIEKSNHERTSAKARSSISIAARTNSSRNSQTNVKIHPSELLDKLC